jgi:hypothetical protein
MTNKKWLILTGVLAIGASFVMLKDHFNQSSPSDSRIGNALIEGALAQKAKKIEITKGEEKVTLLMDARSIWRIDQPDGFPANAATVIRLFDDFSKAKYQRLITEDDGKFADLGLKDATLIAIHTDDSEKPFALSLGAARTGGGQYVAHSFETKAYLVDQSLTASEKATTWEQKTLLDVKKEDVKSIEFIPEKSQNRQRFVVSREKVDDDLLVKGLKDDEQSKANAKSLAGNFSGLTFTKRFDVGNEAYLTALKNPSRAIITFFDGRTYELIAGSVVKDKEPHFLKIVAKKNNATLDTGTDQSLSELNQLMGQWAFEVSSFVAGKLAKDRKEYVEPKKPQEKEQNSKPNGEKGKS